MNLNENLQEQLEAYLLNQLEGDALQAFEQRIAADPALREVVEEHRLTGAVLDEDGWEFSAFNPGNKKAQAYFEFFKDPANQQYFETLKQLSTNQKTRKMNTKSIMGMAAMAAIVVVAVIFFTKKDSPTDTAALYAEYADLENLPEFTVRGSVDSVINLVEDLFHSKDYEMVNQVISENDTTFDEEYKSLINIYQGISYGERGMYDKAYDVLSNSQLYENSVYDQMSEWYLGMAFIKGNAIPRAKEIMTQIARDDSHYKQEDAKKILKQL